MYYINSFFIYSLFGFIMESDIYKITNSKRHSSIFYGPITCVYGVGVIALILIDKCFFKRYMGNRFIKFILSYILCIVTLTIIEFIGGNILHLLFNIDMWNYTSKWCNFGKYICLDLSLIWGVFGVFYLYILKDFIDKFIKLIPNYLTKIFCILFLIDTILVFINK